MKIGFLTAQSLPDLTPDDLLLRQVLARRGHHVEPVIWSEPTWPAMDIFIVRSTWDYFLRAEEFWQKLDTKSQSNRIFNPLPLMQPNGHKSYLVEWYKAGRSVVPSIILREPSFYELSRIIDENGWRELILKPAVSGGGYKTFRLNLEEIIGQRPQTQEILKNFANMDVVVQPLCEEIFRQGEISMTFLSGEYAHAIVKKAGPGEFRIQEKFGGKNLALDPRRDLIEQARTFVPSEALYARVDAIEDADGKLLLMELELIEPDLFFKYSPPSLQKFAEIIEKL